ncbi:TRAP transporter TatT component family protein [Desulforhopalus sp. 52FAK]
MSFKSPIWVLGLLILLLAGCGKKSWHPSWEEAGQITGSDQGEQLYLQARTKIDVSADYESILASMELLQHVLTVEPMHRAALAYLGNLHILLGTAYTVDRAEKTAHFRQAMKYCELSMYTNPEFGQAVNKGLEPWNAVGTLQQQDAEAMLFWVIALQYEFKEGMTMPMKIINVGWLKHAIAFLDRIALVAPDFGNGAVEFAYSICYFALPKIFGGDNEVAEMYMERSISEGKGYLLPRWGKGKYYHQVSGNQKTADKELQWVARQKTEDFNDLFPWRVHFITDAKLQIDAL